MFKRRAMRRVRPRRKGRKVARPRRAIRANPQPTFTETYVSGQIVSGSGGNFTTTFNTIPQYASYQKLYRTFRILKMEVILIPDLPVNTDNGTTLRSVGRFVSAVNSSANLPAPASETDVLIDNGCKIRSMTRPIKLFCKPQPQLEQSGTVFVNSTSRQWLDIDSGLGTVHNGISWWFSTATSAGVSAQVYYKVTFALKDPR